MTIRLSGAAAFLIGFGAASAAGAMDQRGPSATPPALPSVAELDRAVAAAAPASVDPMSLSAGQASTFRLAQLPEGAAARGLAAEAFVAGSAEPVLEIQFQDLQAASQAIPGLRVFLGKPDASLDTPLNDPHYVGSISFFPPGPGDAGGQRFTLPLGETLRKLETRVSPEAADVTLIPVDLGSGAAPPFTVRLSGMGIQ